MTRNLDARIEVVTPIESKELKEEIMSYMDLQWSDNVKARIIDGSMSNDFYVNHEVKLNAQMALYDLLRSNGEQNDRQMLVLDADQEDQG